MISRRRFLAGLAVAGGLASLGARPREAKTMGYEFVRAGSVQTALVTPSSSTLTLVPEGVDWKITGIHGSMQTTATAGDRYLFATFIDPSSNSIRTVLWPNAIPASTGVNAETELGIAPTSTVVVAGVQFLRTPFTPFILPGGYGIALQDAASKDANDQFALAFSYEEYRWVNP